MDPSFPQVLAVNVFSLNDRLKDSTDDLEVDRLVKEQALEAYKLVNEKFKKLNLPGLSFDIPQDKEYKWFKTKEHMNALYNKIEDAKKMARDLEEIKKQRTLKKEGKKIQIETKLARDKEKRDELERIDQIKKLSSSKNKKRNLFHSKNDKDDSDSERESNNKRKKRKSKADDDEFDITVEDALGYSDDNDNDEYDSGKRARKGKISKSTRIRNKTKNNHANYPKREPNRRRQNKNVKFGGRAKGKYSVSKSNDRMSVDNVSSFDERRNKRPFGKSQRNSNKKFPSFNKSKNNGNGNGKRMDNRKSQNRGRGEKRPGGKKENYKKR